MIKIDCYKGEVINLIQSKLSLQGSYGESTVDLRITGGSFIPEGLMVRGKVNILGWTISAFAKLSDSVSKYNQFCFVSYLDI